MIVSAVLPPAPWLAAPGRLIAVADGLQALRIVRSKASHLGIRPDRVGMIGFSAGGMLTMGAILEAASPAERPSIGAAIYATMPPAPVAFDAPPLFIAAARDDETVPVGKSVEIFNSWTAANRPVELHIYENGGHGFGTLRLNSASDNWTNDLRAWLALHEYARERRVHSPDCSCSTCP